MEKEIKVGLTITHRKERGYVNVHGDSRASDLLDYLVTTPTIMNMIVEASIRLLDPHLPSEYITVGKQIELFHDKPTVVGEAISIKLTVTKVDGNYITLDIIGSDDTSQICRGTYEKVAVKKQELIDSAYKRVHV